AGVLGDRPQLHRHLAGAGRLLADLERHLRRSRRRPRRRGLRQDDRLPRPPRPPAAGRARHRHGGPMSALADFTLPKPLRRTLAPLARVVLTEEVETLGLTEAIIDHFELMLRALPVPFRVALCAGLGTFEVRA